MQPPAPDLEQQLSEALRRVNRILDLRLAQDRAVLTQACRDPSDLAELVDKRLDDYLRWFDVPEWHRIYSGGLVSGPKPMAGKGRTQGYSIIHLLRLTECLDRLRHYDGFETLVKNLHNPTQVSATVFEINVAAWCATREVHEELIFSPKVQKAKGPKYPEFLWRSSLGGLYCECKQASQFDRAESQRLGQLCDIAADTIGQEEWPDALRIDVMIEGALGANPDDRLRALLRQLASNVHRGGQSRTLRDGALTATVRSRADTFPTPPDSIATCRITVTDQPTALGPQNSSVQVVRSLSALRAKIVRDLVKEAKKQLPDDGPAAVFLDMSGAEAAAGKLREMLERRAHSNIVWACVCTQGTPQVAVWQDGQPFDDRLLR